MGPDSLGEFLFILQIQIFVISSVLPVRTVRISTKILSSRTKLQWHRRPASELDKFLSKIKTVRFFNLHALI